MSALGRETDLDRIDAEASQWMILAQDDGVDEGRERDFEAWCAADPRHRPAFESARALWNEMPAFDNLASLLTPADASDSTNSRRQWPRLVGGALSAIAAVWLALVFVPRRPPQPGTHYQTALATSRIITLEDGSSVTLGPRSAIKVNFETNERRVVLTGGEAFFEVVHDAGRPFVVQAGNSIIHDIGTKFDVNLTKATVRVAVLEGVVAVAIRDVGRSAKPQLLRAGERAEVVQLPADPRTASASPSETPPAPVTPLPAQAAGAWRDGRLVFDNVRLADLADDVNRYYGPGVRVVGDVADLRVTASFRTSEIPMFMRSISESFPVRTSTGDGGAFEIRAATQ